MNIGRRQLLSLAATSIVTPLLTRFAWAEGYPSRPVRVVVGFPAGGTTDVAARLLGQWLSERLGQPFVIENRPGAATNLATEAVVRAPADGYTLLLSTSSNLVNATLHDKLNYDFQRDIAPVASIMSSPLVLEVVPAVPVDTFPEFIAYAKANPGTVNLASFGTGTISHLSGELLKMMTGIETVHVPYRGSAPMLIDLLGGRIHAAFDNIPASMEHIRSGSLRALAVTTAGRSEALPNVPTVGELLPGFEVSAIAGIGAPKGTPAEIVSKLNKEINAGLADPKLKGRLTELGATALGGSPEGYGKLIVTETEKWGKVVRYSSAKPN